MIKNILYPFLLTVLIQGCITSSPQTINTKVFSDDSTFSGIVYTRDKGRLAVFSQTISPDKLKKIAERAIGKCRKESCDDFNGHKINWIKNKLNHPEADRYHPYITKMLPVDKNKQGGSVYTMEPNFPISREHFLYAKETSVIMADPLDEHNLMPGPDENFLS